MTGDDGVTLQALSDTPNAPALDTLKKRSRSQDWAGQRLVYRHQVGTKTREAASTTEAEVSARHAKTARAMLGKALQRLQQLRPEDLNAAEVRQYIKDAAEIERKALGMEVSRVDVNHYHAAEPSRAALELLKDDLERTLN